MHGPALLVTGLLATGAIASPWGRPEWATDVEEGRPEWTGTPSWWGEGHDPEHRRPTTTADAVTENTAAAATTDAEFDTTAVVKNVTPVAPEPTMARHNGTRAPHTHQSHVSAHNATRAATTLQTVASHSTTHVPFVLSSLISDHFMATHTPSPVTTAAVTTQPASQQPKNQQPHSSQKSEEKPSATTAGSSSTGSPTNSGNGAKASTYQEAVIMHHNYHRANHSSPDIAWDDKLASSAAKIAATCKFAHSMDVDGGGYGQNIAAGVGPEKISDVITGMFYNGEVNHFSGYYGTENPPNFENWGHFSQVVWKETTHVACATQDCRSAKGKIAGADVDSYFTVCNYGPAGNMGGTYVKNIGKSLGKPSITWTEGLSDAMVKAGQS